jgi:hypothetical protein
MPLTGPERVARIRARLKARLLEQHGGKCQTCGSTQDLEFAHIKPTKVKGKGRGMKERLWDIKKHPTPYTLLCNWCHAILDGRADPPLEAISAEEEFRIPCIENDCPA